MRQVCHLFTYSLTCLLTHLFTHSLSLTHTYLYNFHFILQGNVYISDTFNQRIRKVLVSSNSIITTLAGTGSSGFSGDSSPAALAKINNPYGITLDSAGNLYVCDTYNNRVRKVATSTSIITTIAGSGYTGMNTGSYSGDTGQATSAALNCPMSVSLDTAGTLYSRLPYVLPLLLIIHS